MAVSKVQKSNGDVLIDLTSDTVTPSALMTGYTAHDKTGMLITGTASGGSGDGYVWQDAEGYIHLSDEEGTSISVEPLSVTQNGTYTAPTGHAYSPVSVSVSEGGTTSAEEKDVNFYDYDGTCLYSYTFAEWANVSSLPTNPSHSGLVSQGWNWTKSQIDSYLSNVGGRIYIGQLYDTQSGGTEIDVRLTDASLRPYLGIYVNGSVSIDWGDNSTSTLTGTSTRTRKFSNHTYSEAGLYTITITPASGTVYELAGASDSSVSVLYVGDSSDSDTAYSARIEAIRLGGSVYIGALAFNFVGMRYITMPTTVYCDGSTGMFRYCGSLRFLAINSHFAIGYQGPFTGCGGLEVISLPSSTDYNSLGITAFNESRLLKSITLPSNLQSLSSGCLSMTAIDEIYIPSSVTSIEGSAFPRSLKKIHLKSETPPTIASSTFTNCNTNKLTIYVPTSALADYQEAQNWSNYASKMVGE